MTKHEFESSSWPDAVMSLCNVEDADGHMCSQLASDDIHMPDMAKDAQGANTAQESTPEEVEARLAKVDLIGSLVNIHRAIRGEDCPRHLALGMATSAVSALKAENQRLRAAIETASRDLQGIREALKWVK